MEKNSPDSRPFRKTYQDPHGAVRGYEMRLLKREFCRVIDKYRTEFQKWDIPLDSKKFFTDIFA